ncbi:SCO family protein [Marinimicrobium sp. ABcell2]|uniref:SCO family protein n=1 Tax=Marinimicrobium sp. ABcell2 TaxID=3069751 RepID=UPI0027B21E5B|nr:SCO family protein [Marinimicrobium sp. ABcell2]MDQ2076234.1 SCO family protein [Marinimicrobium sp. ABcell2]
MSQESPEKDQSSHPHLDADRKRGIRRTVVVLILAVALVIGMLVFNVTRAPVVDREALREQGAVLLEQPRRFTDFELVDHRGESFTREDLKGKWTFIFFGFTHCPDICPLAMVDLSRLVNELPADMAEQTQVLMVSLDPARDTPEVLADYVPYFHEDFVGVTGEFLTIRRFANELNVAFAKVTQGDDYTVDHSGHITLINPKGDYHAIFTSPFNTGSMQTAYRTIVNSFPF